MLFLYPHADSDVCLVMKGDTIVTVFSRVVCLAWRDAARSAGRRSTRASPALPPAVAGHVAAGGSVTVGGQGLPRLQELAYLETIAKAVAAGLPFEQIRLALVDHIWGDCGRRRQETPPTRRSTGRGVATRRSTSETSPTR